MLTIPETIQVGDLSTGLSGNYRSKKRLFGGILNTTTPVLIAMATDAIRWRYAADPTDTTLRGTANYAYWLFGKFGLEAQELISLGGGGSVVPITPGGTMPNPYDFEVPLVANNGAPIAAGVSSITFDGTNNTQDLRGYNVEFIRGSIPQYTTNPGDGSTYYSWNRVTGLFTISVAAFLGERFRIYV